jgi:hypothetical protein
VGGGDVVHSLDGGLMTSDIFRECEDSDRHDTSR